MQVEKGDSTELLKVMQPPDVIYIDPMLPPRKKGSHVKEEMRVLQMLLGNDAESPELFPVAQSVARKRVVVKRPLKAKPIVSFRKPGLVLKGKTTRFDVYFTSKPIQDGSENEEWEEEEVEEEEEEEEWEEEDEEE